MPVARSSKILTSKEEIKAYLGGISNHLFAKYIKLGLPARYEDNRWIAHTDNIDNFFLAYTKVSMSKIIDQIPDTAEEAENQIYVKKNNTPKTHQ